MTILAIDTSGPVAGVALCENGALRYEAMAVNRYTHSASIMPMAEEAFARTGLTMDDVTLLAACAGPGSFTGVRIGISAVKGLARAKNLPCIAVDALDALYEGVKPFSGTVLTILDARAGQVYGAAYHQGEKLLPDCALKLEAFADAVKPLIRGDVLVTGDGTAMHGQRLLALLGTRGACADMQNRTLRASCVAAIAQRNAERAADGALLTPIYLRAPQAERERAARMNA